MLREHHQFDWFSYLEPLKIRVIVYCSRLHMSGQVWFMVTIGTSKGIEDQDNLFPYQMSLSQSSTCFYFLYIFYSIVFLYTDCCLCGLLLTVIIFILYFLLYILTFFFKTSKQIILYWKDNFEKNRGNSLYLLSCSELDILLSHTSSEMCAC